jgi:hypothetical protein
MIIVLEVRKVIVQEENIDAVCNIFIIPDQFVDPKNVAINNEIINNI